MKQNESLNKKASFTSQLREYGILKLIKSLDFKISLGFVVFYYLDGRFNWNYLSHSSNDGYITTIIAAASVLFALTITSLSIILSFSSSVFVKFLQKNNMLSPILFLFWLGNGAYLLSIASALGYFILNPAKLPTVHEYLFISAIGFFIYALVNTFYLLATIIKFGYFMSAFDEEMHK